MWLAGTETKRRVRKYSRRDRSRASLAEALLWLGPALLLIVMIVLYPAVTLVATSFGTFSITGLRKGDAEFANYVDLLTNQDLSRVVGNTGIWVGLVVLFTILIGLALAQVLSKEFFGRRLVRWAVIVPWASALVISSQLFRLVYDYYHGILNQLFLSMHLIQKPIDWLGDTRFTLGSMIVVGVFVSVPFTAYLFVAGLSSIPADLYEAARIDGGRPWQIYRHITLPLLRPAILTAVVLNIIYVFNSFPIVWILNGSNPGFGQDTMITYMYKLAFRSAQHDVGLSAAAGVVNLIVVVIAVITYLRFVNWRGQAQS